MPTIEVFVPVPPDVDERTSETFSLGQRLPGVHVGLRLDTAWRAYETVVATWTRLFERDGAQVHALVTGERVGPKAEQTRGDIDEWARLIDVGVVGLGN